MNSARPPHLTRRDLLRGAAATAAAFGLSGCVTGERAAVSSDEPTTTGAPAPLPSAALVGDSISFLSREPLEAELADHGFGTIEFDALPGRRIAEGESSGLDVLDFSIAAGLAPDLWIVQLGTNDLGNYEAAGYAELIDLVLRRIP